jgi:hypothetical protein
MSINAYLNARYADLCKLVAKKPEWVSCWEEDGETPWWSLTLYMACASVSVADDGYMAHVFLYDHPDAPKAYPELGRVYATPERAKKAALTLLRIMQDKTKDQLDHLEYEDDILTYALAYVAVIEDLQVCAPRYTADFVLDALGLWSLMSAACMNVVGALLDDHWDSGVKSHHERIQCLESTAY